MSRSALHGPLRPVLAAIVVGALVAGLPAAGAAADRGRPDLPPDLSIATWDATATRAALTASPSPPDAAVILAYVGIATYDAVMAVTGDYEPFTVDAQAPPGTSAEAAVAAAARTVLLHHLPGQAGIVEPDYAAALAAIPDGPSKADGIALGEQVAAELIVQRADDGFRDPQPVVPPAVPPIPGRWISTSDPAAPGLGAYLADMTPFTLRSPAQFRPDAPPALDSRRWAREYTEVQQIGSATAPEHVRSTEQTVAARFWGQHPIAQMRGALRNFIDQRDLDISDAARFTAMMSVTFADAFIACFEAKFHYLFWRPVTAIRAGDTDGNPRTVADPGWTSLVAPPNHPEYPSAHACITPAAAVVVSRFLHSSHIDFTVPSVVPGMADRTFETRRQLITEVTEARIWAGIHFRSSVESGAVLATRTANWVVTHHFGR